MAEAFAVYCETDQSLNFYKRDTVPTAGSVFEGKVATAVYTGIETGSYTASTRPWASVAGSVVSVTFVDEVSPISTRQWFNNFGNLSSINLKKLNTSQTINMNLMFGNCSSLTSLDLSTLKTGSVTVMSSMFRGCSGLTALDLSVFDTNSATNMASMFEGCSGLTSLDLNSFNTGKVTNMSNMFDSCTKLTGLNIKSFNTAIVTTMDYMFFNCPELTVLDLTSFDTSSAAIMDLMFYDCAKLTTIYVSDTWDVKNVQGEEMFVGCTSLVGDIAYNPSYTGPDYATYDGGYLTYKKFYPAGVEGDFLINGTVFYDIADAIRNLTSTENQLAPDEMVDVLSGIKNAEEVEF